jgi:hypothetical protein
MGIKEPKITKDNAADVAKHYNDVGSTETLTVWGAYCAVSKSNSTDKIVCSDEDGNTEFCTFSLDAAGTCQYLFPKGVGIPKGKDIKLTRSGSTARADIWFHCTERTVNSV